MDLHYAYHDTKRLGNEVSVPDRIALGYSAKYAIGRVVEWLGLNRCCYYNSVCGLLGAGSWVLSRFRPPVKL